MRSKPIAGKDRKSLGIRADGIFGRHRLTPADVDLDKRLLYVRAKTIDGKFWQPKTKRNRVVPISLALAEILSMYTPKREGPWAAPRCS